MDEVIQVDPRANESDQDFFFTAKKREEEEAKPEKPKAKISGKSFMTMQFLSSKNMGFSSKQCPITSQNEQNPVKIKAQSSTDLLNYITEKKKREVEALQTIPETTFINPQFEALGLSKSTKKWNWAGSKGNFDKKEVAEWHEYIDYKK